MKKLTFLSVALLLFCLSLEAQIRTDEFDFLKKDISNKESREAIIENQRHLKLQPLLQTYLRDSAFYYDWDSPKNSWSDTPYQLVRMEYNYQGFSTWVRFYAWETTTSRWLNTNEFHYVRDIYGNMTEWIYNIYNANTNTWIPYEHDSMTYANNILISESWNYYNEDNNTWIKGASWKYNYNGALLEAMYLYLNAITYEIGGGTKEIYTLNQQDKPSEQIVQDFTIPMNVWVNSRKTESFYQNDTVILNELVYSWNISNASWDPYAKSLYYYSGNLQTEVINQSLIESVWINYSRLTYEYNPAGYPTKTVFQGWTGNNWENVSQTLNTYNNNNVLTETLVQSYSAGWMNSSLYGFTFDNNGNQTERVYKKWDLSTGLLTNYSYRYLYTFDINNLNTELVFQKWNTTNVDWLNDYKIDYYFSIHEINGFTEPIRSSVYVYPNPVDNILFLKGLNGNEKVSIFDLTGKLLFSQQISNHQIDVRNYQSGIYTIKIESSKGIVTREFIRQ